MHYLYLNPISRSMFVSADAPNGSFSVTDAAPDQLLIATGSKSALTKLLERRASLGYTGESFSFPYLDVSLANIARAQVLFNPKKKSHQS